MGGQGGQDLATVGLAIADGFAQQAIDRQQARARQELATTTDVFSTLAKRGQLGGLDRDVIKAAQKRLGKDAVEALMFQSSVNEPLNNLREAQIDRIQAPTLERVEGPPVQGFAQGVQGPPRPMQEVRPSTPEEQLQRFERTGPLGVGLVDLQLGQLQAASLRAAAADRTKSSSERRQIRGVLIDLAKQNRLVDSIPAEQFDPATLQPGLSTLQLGNDVIIFRQRGPLQFPNPSAEQAALAQQLGLTAEEASSIDGANQIAELKREIELGKVGETARVKADTKRLIFNQQSLFQSMPNHRLYNNQTGERVNSRRITEEAIADPTTKELTTQTEKSLNDLRSANGFANEIAELVARVYGRGGIFDNLQSGGRLTAAAKGFMARQLQSDPDLVQLQRLQEGRLAALLRASGQVGSLSDQDVQRGLALLADVGTIPDTSEQAFRSVEALYDFFGERAATILGNRDFQFQGRLDVRERAQGALVTPEEAGALGNNFGFPPDVVQQMQSAVTTNPRLSRQELLRAARELMRRRGGQ